MRYNSSKKLLPFILANSYRNISKIPHSIKLALGVILTNIQDNYYPNLC